MTCADVIAGDERPTCCCCCLSQSEAGQDAWSVIGPIQYGYGSRAKTSISNLPKLISKTEPSVCVWGGAVRGRRLSDKGLGASDLR